MKWTISRARSCGCALAMAVSSAAAGCSVELSPELGGPAGGPVAAAPLSNAGGATGRLLWDDFEDGFSAEGPGAKWFYFQVASYVGDDGIATTGDEGLSVVSSGVNPVTGEPAFVRTLAQDDDNGGLPGVLDHVKWLVYTNHQSSRGYPGFDAAPGREVGCEATVGGRTFGTSGHPFGSYVTDPEDDNRLAAFALTTADFETFMVFDFFLTNETIYAFYERTPSGRAILGDYASFSHAIPVAANRPGRSHKLAILYDKARGTVRWLVNGGEVFSVDTIGFRLPRSTMTLDHGGVEALVSPNQLVCGMGMFTLLDGHLPSGIGLVRIVSAPDYYFNPELGAPAPETFVDDESLESSRLFGQGAQIDVRRYYVVDRPAP